MFLDDHGNVKLGDFGLARILHHNFSLAQTFVGTPYYMSPVSAKSMYIHMMMIHANTHTCTIHICTCMCLCDKIPFYIHVVSLNSVCMLVSLQRSCFLSKHMMRSQTCGALAAYFMNSAPWPLLSQPKTSTLLQLRYMYKYNIYMYMYVIMETKKYAKSNWQILDPAGIWTQDLLIISLTSHWISCS